MGAYHIFGGTQTNRFFLLDHSPQKWDTLIVIWTLTEVRWDAMLQAMNSYCNYQSSLYFAFTYSVQSRSLGQARESAAAAVAAVALASNKR